jgi:hypothetical protein
MNLREIVGGIRLRVIEENAGSGTASIELRAACEEMQSLGAAVGRMPPSPNTTRAKLGAYLVRTVQRMLFWYTPQIVRFNAAASLFAEQVCLTTEKHVAAIQEIDAKMTELSGEVHRAGQAHSSAPPEEVSVSTSGFDQFISDFRNRSESSAVDRQWVFRELHHMLELARPVAGPWLDVDGGSGEWMNSVAVQESGHEIASVDTSALLSEESGPMPAVITAIRVLERQPMVRSFELMRSCARRLAPGGLLMVTGADPASVLAGATEFWEDPRSVRPVPSSIVAAMIEYLGLRIVETRSLRPWSGEDQLPLATLEPVRELNARLYAPREYAILARRELP